MPAIDIILESDGAFNEVPPEKLAHTTETIRVVGHEGGMRSGKPSVAIVMFLRDGSCVIGETSLALFLMAADTLKARFGDPRT